MASHAFIFFFFTLHISQTFVTEGWKIENKKKPKAHI